MSCGQRFGQLLIPPEVVLPTEVGPWATLLCENVQRGTNKSKTSAVLM